MSRSPDSSSNLPLRPIKAFIPTGSVTYPGRIKEAVLSIGWRPEVGNYIGETHGQIAFSIALRTGVAQFSKGLTNADLYPFYPLMENFMTI